MAYPKHRKKVPYEKLLLLEDDLSLIDGLSLQDLPYGAKDQAGGVRSYFSIPVTE